MARALDLLVAWAARRWLIGRRSHRTDPEALARLLESLAPGNTTTLFPTPPLLSSDDVQIISDDPLWGAEHLRFRMPSARPSPIVENQTIWGRALLPADQSWQAPVVILAHPWIGPGGVKLLKKFGRPLLRHGVGAVTVQMPHHMRRTAPGHWSGELAVCGDLASVAESALQAVADMRRVVAWLQSLGVPRVGMMGYSLGGGLAALMAAAEPSLDCVVAVVPPADALAPLHRSPLTCGPIRSDLDASGLSENLLSEFSRLFSPLSHPPTLPPERLLVVSAEHDAILPPALFERLADLWHCALWHERQSHISLFHSRRFHRRLAAWLAERLSG